MYYKFSKNKYIPGLNSYCEQYIINLFIDQLEELSKEYDLGPVSFEIEYIPEKVFYIGGANKTLDELDKIYNYIIDDMSIFSKNNNVFSFFKDVNIVIKY